MAEWISYLRPPHKPKARLLLVYEAENMVATRVLNSVVIRQTHTIVSWQSDEIVLSRGPHAFLLVFERVKP